MLFVMLILAMSLTTVRRLRERDTASIGTVSVASLLSYVEILCRVIPVPV